MPSKKRKVASITINTLKHFSRRSSSAKLCKFSQFPVSASRFGDAWRFQIKKKKKGNTRFLMEPLRWIYIFSPREFARVATRVSNSPRSRIHRHRISCENGFYLARREGKWPERRNDAPSRGRSRLQFCLIFNSLAVAIWSLFFFLFFLEKNLEKFMQFG